MLSRVKAERNMDDVSARDWNDLQDKLFRDSWDTAINRYRSPYAFRGLSDKRYQLSSSLIRLGGAYVALEQGLLRNFRKYASRSFLPTGSIWEWMAMGQHYGLPTRLIDWTYSPYVALHFATANREKFDRDGVAGASISPRQNSSSRRRSGGRWTKSARMCSPWRCSRPSALSRVLTDWGDRLFVIFLEPPRSISVSSTNSRFSR